MLTLRQLKHIYFGASFRIQSFINFQTKKNLDTPSLLVFKPKKAEMF